MMTNKKADDIIELLKKACLDLVSIERAALFGSRARGDNKERSDYDVAFFGDVTEQDKLALNQKIEELPTLLKVDVVYASELEQDKFLENILKEGVIFYDRAWRE